MSRVAARSRRAIAWLPSALVAALLLALLVVAPVGLSAQTEGSVPLREEMRQRLQRIQETWIDWLAAAQEGDLARAGRSGEDLLAAATVIDMARLPQLAVAAAAAGDRLVRAGSLEQARAAVEMAERLDPGTPEVAVVRASLVRAEGSGLEALLWQARAWVRTLAQPLYRQSLIGDALFWSLTMLTLVAGAFVAVQWATRGILLFRDVVRFFSRSVPSWVAHVLCAALLLWPVLLPSGLLWLALFWSLLVWGYGSRWERAALVGVWLFVSLVPLLVETQLNRMRSASTPSVRAMQNVVDGRLTGTLFHDLAPLVEDLDGSPAADHFLADLHLRMHQWELARQHYNRVLSAEPENAAAIGNLGTCLFYEGDLDRAIQRLRQATELDRSTPETLFVLSRALSEKYRFDESETALRSASEIDSERVAEWIRRQEDNRVVMAGGGFARMKEVRRELTSVWSERDAERDLTTFWRRTMSLPLVFVFALLAIGLYFIARRSGNRSRRIEPSWFAEPFETLRRTLLPGFFEGETGRWPAAVIALAVPLILLGLNFWSRIASGVPWSLTGSVRSLSFLPLILLIAYLAVRGFRLMRHPGESD